jgi:hypothetical protein
MKAFLEKKMIDYAHNHLNIAPEFHFMVIEHFDFPGVENCYRGVNEKMHRL